MMLSTKTAQMVLLHWTKRATRALDKKYLYTAFLPESLVQIQNNFTELFLMMRSTKIAQNGPASLNKKPEL